MDKLLTLRNMALIEAFSSRFARLGDRYILSHIDTREQARSTDDNPFDTTKLPGLNVPLRLDGMLYILVQKGRITINVNTDTYKVGSGNILVVRPGTLMCFTKLEQHCRFTLLFISTTFLSHININLNNIEFKTIMATPAPVLQLYGNETDKLRKYFDLLDSNTLHRDADPKSIFATHIALTLITAMVYEILRFSAARLTEGSTKDSTPPESHRQPHYYVFRFMQLLHVHYVDERNLSYYASELCISTKYLSKVTKDITGYTASQWIARVTITEAKNLLTFSGKNIQEVAYALNFPSQSAFGKYFKRFTGHSPSQYIKTDYTKTPTS